MTKINSQPRKVTAIIPASGIGSRMGSDKPKQYLLLQGKTILEHAIQPFLDHPEIVQVVVAVAKNDLYYQTLPIFTSPKIQLVFGGETRANSVLNALKVVNEQYWVMVHDAARPCLKRSDIDKLLQINDMNGAILAAPTVDTIKRAEYGQISQTEDRSTLWRALTPQFFNAGQLKTALESALSQHLAITDEASAMELCGYRPHLVIGRGDNIKVTHPEDLALAEFYLQYHR